MERGNLILMDGAMGSALRDRGVAVPDHVTSIWSALSLIEHPDAVVRLHRDYIDAGSDWITTNNYAVTPASLAKGNMEHRLDELTERACRLATSARDTAGRPVKIAGSLPPLTTSYRADLVGDEQEIYEQYQRLTRVMAPYVDLFLCETLTTSREGRAAARAGLETGKPVYLSWTLSDTSAALRGGEPVAEAVKAMSGLPIEGFLINCSSLQATEKGLKALANATDLPFGAFANPFQKEPKPGDYGEDNPDWTDAKSYALECRKWIDLGATLVGGCCGTTPDYISELAQSFNEGF